MQKISNYLYSNRVYVIADMACFPVEWRLVYQRTIKLYKGMENIVEFDVRNADQKRVNISNYTMKCAIMDVNNREILTADIDTTAATCSTGIGIMLVNEHELSGIDPQYLKYTVYIENQDGSKTPVYGDTQFGVGGTIQLIGGVLPEEPTPQIIDVFNYINNDDLLNPTNKTYISEAVEVNPKNDINESHVINLEFRSLSLDAEVKVRITTDVVVSTATSWTDLETFIITPSTDLLTKSYSEVEDYSNNIGWLRIEYTPTTTNTGRFDKVLVRS
jgi:hypothetical protein